MAIDDRWTPIDDRCTVIIRWTALEDRWTAIERWTGGKLERNPWSGGIEKKRWNKIYCSWTFIDRWTVRSLEKDHWIEGSKRLPCWLERQSRLDLRPGP
jgi:hypothetical protein